MSVRHAGCFIVPRRGPGDGVGRRRRHERFDARCGNADWSTARALIGPNMSSGILAVSNLPSIAAVTDLKYTAAADGCLS
jgi:hypothetical protein